MAKLPEHVLIVGGGIIGLSSAHFLSEAGVQVTVIDQGKIGAACSHGNCGLINPSHVFPLPRPGAFKNAIKALLKPNGPFRVQPTLNPQLYFWLLRFARNGNLKAMRHAGWARHHLLTFSREFYSDFISGNQIECDFEERGCLFVYGKKQTLDEHDQFDAMMTKEYGVGAEKLTGDELEKMEPAFLPGVAAGAWFYPQDAHLRADKLIKGWRKLLEDRGVQFREMARVTEFVPAQSRMKSIEVTNVNSNASETLTCDALVIATGSWTPMLNKKLGCKIPIQPGKGYSLTMPRPEICPTIPMILEDEKVAVTPMASGYRLGSTMEFVGYNTTINPKRLELLTKGATKYLRDPVGKMIEEQWYGWRPMTPNGLPLIGPTPKYQNVYVAAGHNMIGIMTAPATGRLVTELILQKQPSIDPKPYAVA